jgi:hypothetical protein
VALTGRAVTSLELLGPAPTEVGSAVWVCSPDVAPVGRVVLI